MLGKRRKRKDISCLSSSNQASASGGTYVIPCVRVFETKISIVKIEKKKIKKNQIIIGQDCFVVDISERLRANKHYRCMTANPFLFLFLWSVLWITELRASNGGINKSNNLIIKFM